MTTTVTPLTIEEDIQEAVRALWLSVDSLKAIDAVGPKADELPSPQPDVYCQVLVTKEGARENERMTGGVFLDYRKATLNVYAVRAQAVVALGAMRAVFGLKMIPAELVGLPSQSGALTLTMPSGAPFKRWWPLGDGTLKDTGKQKAGNQIYQATVEGEVWTVRTE